MTGAGTATVGPPSAECSITRDEEGDVKTPAFAKNANVGHPARLNTFRILDGVTVAYLDLTGSGIETVGH